MHTPKIYQHAPEIWDEKTCKRAATRVARDGLGTKYPWPGYIGNHYGTVKYNGGCLRPRDTGEWYEGEHFPLPIVAPGYRIIHVRTWGYRIILAPEQANLHADNTVDNTDQYSTAINDYP